MAGHSLTVVIARGRCTVEFVVRSNGSCPGRDFLEEECEQIREGSKRKPDSTARAKFMVLFQQMAATGHLSPKRFKREMGKLFAFSHELNNVQIRFPCFQDGERWIVTHGFIKPGAKKRLGQWPESQVNRANELMNEYFSRKKALVKTGEQNDEDAG